MRKITGFPSFFPASLKSVSWTDNEYNLATNLESNRIRIGGRTELIFTPYFKNHDWSMTMLGRYEMSTQKYNQQTITTNRLASGLTRRSMVTRVALAVPTAVLTPKTFCTTDTSPIRTDATI